MYKLISITAAVICLGGCAAGVDPGPRPAALAAELEDSTLKQKLLSCSTGPFNATPFSIAHRGAPLAYPEHTREGYQAAAAMGAGIIECDVTFTKDLALVCRHSQCDLHSTTNILTTPLAATCRQPFQPSTDGQAASAQCCTSEITLAEFKSLCGRRDVVNAGAGDIATYLNAGTPKVAHEPVSCGTLLTHAESIELIDQLGADFTPELKRPEVELPFAGMSRQDYADRLLEEYRAAGINPARVHPQSFDINDLHHWIDKHPDFAARAVYLDPRGRDPDFRPTAQGMQALRAAGITTLAPPMPMLLVQDASGRLVASPYARMAQAAGLDLITWTLEAGDPADPDNWMYANLPGYMTDEARMLEVLHALAEEVGIRGIFSDWPGTVTYYANCFGR